MMLKRCMTGLIIVAMLAVDAPPAWAQYSISSECLSDTYAMMAHEQRLYRSVLFGRQSAKSLPVGSALYDSGGNSWLKTDTNTWKSLSATDSQSDKQMDDSADIPVRRGIFEIRQAPTSDLIPPLTQAFRAFTCRLRAVCGAVAQANGTDSSTPTMKVQPVGCIEFTENVPNGCRAGSAAAVNTDSCDQMVDSVLDRERTLLTLTVAYDAAERTLWQFRGIFEQFIGDFQFPLLNPLWQTVRALGAFSKLPCFIGQCDQ
jgi:hypothetical protein